MFDTDPPQIKVREPLALIGIEDVLMASDIQSQVQALGFRTDVVGIQREIANALKQRDYDLIVLQEGYDGGAIEDNEVLLDVVSWSSDRRRLRYCVLVGGSFATADELQAFLYSMDMVLNIKDVQHFGAYLQMGLGQKQESLARFNEVNRLVELA